MLRNMTLLTTACCLMAMASCRKSGTDKLLDDAGKYMNEDPKKALAVLDSIGGEEMQGRKRKARFALLYSMALDKNYIDISDDSIIAPAAAWYRWHGTADEKLKTWYYIGRIRQNAGDIDAAMECFVKAEKYAGHADDKTYAGLVYSAKASIYESLFCIGECMSNTLAAAENYLEAKDTSRYIYSVLSACYDCLSTEDYDMADKWLSAIWPLMKCMSEDQKSGCYAIALHSAYSQGKETGNIITEYLKNVRDSSRINWIEMAYSHYSTGDWEKGLKALEFHRSINSEYSRDPAYLWVNSVLNEQAGRYMEALKSFKDYVIITDSTDMEIFKSDAKFAEDREIAEYRISAREFWLTVMALGMVTLILGAVLVFSKLQEKSRKRQAEKEKIEKEKAALEKEKDNYMKLYGQAMDEKRHLQRIRKETGLDREIRKSIEERLGVLNKFITAALSKNLSSSASETLGEFMDDREKFLHSTKISFIIMHPEFISYLKDCGLTEWEIGCCCLYCIGLNGNEIAAYLRRKSFYNASSTIRRKLGLEKHGTNLDNFLRTKMLELD